MTPSFSARRTRGSSAATSKDATATASKRTARMATSVMSDPDVHDLSDDVRTCDDHQRCEDEQRLTETPMKERTEVAGAEQRQDERQAHGQGGQHPPRETPLGGQRPHHPTELVA